MKIMKGQMFSFLSTWLLTFLQTHSIAGSLLPGCKLAAAAVSHVFLFIFSMREKNGF